MRKRLKYETPLDYKMQVQHKEHINGNIYMHIKYMCPFLCNQKPEKFLCMEL